MVLLLNFFCFLSFLYDAYEEIELWLDLWIKISFKLSWIILFKSIEHKQTQIITIEALININTTLDF